VIERETEKEARGLAHLGPVTSPSRSTVAEVQVFSARVTATYATRLIDAHALVRTVRQCSCVWQEAFLQTHHEHDRPLSTLRLVDGAESDALGVIHFTCHLLITL
jgi:hypothetical protein